MNLKGDEIFLNENITPRKVFEEYLRGDGYNRAVNLYENVRRNEDFYMGEQWKGVHAPDLEKPVLNFLKRAVNYLVSMVVSNDVAASLTPTLKTDDGIFTADVLTGEVESVIEHAKAKSLARDMVRSCAVDGDGCFYFWYEPLGGQKGRIRIESLENTKVIFGNPYIKEVEDQPYIILIRRRSAAEVRREAKENGSPDWTGILPDSGKFEHEEDPMGDLTTELIRLWKEDGKVRYMLTAGECLVKPAADTGMCRYPIAWMNWEPSRGSYHGRAAVTGIIPNQIFVNKLWAMAMEHEKHMAFPKLFYDATKIREWTNRVGQAIGVAGDPNTAVASSFRPSDMSAQALELVEKTMSYTKECLGANDIALGNVALDNTSAIIALQSASAAPLSIQTQSFYQFWEDCVRIILDMIRCYYGIREVNFETAEGASTVLMDFSSVLPEDQLNITVEVGASSYWSELMQVQTADSLFKNGVISDPVTYLESVPAKFIRGRDRIIARLSEQKAAENPAQKKIEK